MPIFQDLNTYGGNLRQWQYGLTNVPFSPDSVIVRQVTYCAGNGGAATTLLSLYSDLVDDQVLCSFTTPCCSNLNSIHLLNGNSVNRVFNFWVITVTGAVSTADNGQLSVELEFIKH